MAQKGLQKDRNTYTAIQTFCPVKGQCNLESGDYTGYIIRCVEDGDITFTWAEGGDDTISIVAGDDYAIRSGATVTIVSGKHHIA